MELVEVVVGTATDQRRRSSARCAACRAIGKTTIEVADRPGFATSRINAMIGNEAFTMLMEGVATAEDIDTGMKLALNHPMGPFELVDLVGLDTRLSVLRRLHEGNGERFRPSPLLVSLSRPDGSGARPATACTATTTPATGSPDPPPSATAPVAAPDGPRPE